MPFAMRQHPYLVSLPSNANCRGQALVWGLFSAAYARQDVHQQCLQTTRNHQPILYTYRSAFGDANDKTGIAGGILVRPNLRGGAVQRFRGG